MRQKNYTSYRWQNVEIGDKQVTSVVVRIYSQPQVLSVKPPHQIICTDGTVSNGKKTASSKISDYNYAILSTGISSNSSDNLYLHLNLFIGQNFDELVLNKLNFEGKVYILDALTQYHTNVAIRKVLTKVGFISHLEQAVEKMGGNFETVYNKLVKLVIDGDYETADYHMNMYNIRPHFRAIFWRELFKMAMSKELIS